jgi:energy-coupling factor transporter ATP-binding protein EcfA2
MITRLYVDNYKGLNDFTLEPQQLTLLLGENGSGKSTVFEVLDALRRLLTPGYAISHCFPLANWSRPSRDTKLTVAIDLLVPEGLYTYSFAACRYGADSAHIRLKSERLALDGRDLLHVEPYEFEDEAPDTEGIPGAQISIWSSNEGRHLLTHPQAVGDRSELSTFPPLEGAAWVHHRGFVQYLSKLCPLALDPKTWKVEVSEPTPWPSRSGDDFVGWLWHLSESAPEVVAVARNDWAQIGFSDVHLIAPTSTSRKLVIALAQPNGHSLQLSLDALSDGQRALLALYALTAAMQVSPITLLLDEPDNYLSPREIQPWLGTLQDRVFDTGSQAILISHHPEVLSSMGRSNGILLSVDDSGGVRARPSQDWPGFDQTPYQMLATGLIHSPRSEDE